MADTAPTDPNPKTWLIQDDLLGEHDVNVQQNFITTTVDRIDLCLRDHLDASQARNGWLAPVGMFIATLTTLVSASFNNFLFSGDVWKAMFIIATGLTGIWSIIAAVAAVKAPSKSASIGQIISKLKRDKVAAPRAPALPEPAPLPGLPSKSGNS